MIFCAEAKRVVIIHYFSRNYIQRKNPLNSRSQSPSMHDNSRSETPTQTTVPSPTGSPNLASVLQIETNVPAAPSLPTGKEFYSRCTCSKQKKKIYLQLLRKNQQTHYLSPYHLDLSEYCTLRRI